MSVSVHIDKSLTRTICDWKCLECDAGPRTDLQALCHALVTGHSLVAREEINDRRG